ncbi:MAG: helix-hairpin-helix domain-containing protein [Candidatus Omnitrophota bacterium]
MILTLIFMLVLAVMAMAMAYFITTETRGIGFQLDDTKALYLAQAGVERALREIRDDVLTTTQTGEADLRGNTTSGTAENATRRDYVRYFDEGRILTLDSAGAGTYVILSDYDLNYLGTRIKNVQIGCRYGKNKGGGADPSLEILYTTNGTFPQPGNSSFTTVVSSTSFNASPFIVLDITGDRTWNWSVINSPNFQIRARGFNSSNRDVQVDHLFLQVTYEVDTNTEAWHTGTYATFPISLGDGTIQSVSIADEAEKVHLNYASQPLLRYLMEERGIASGTANTLATNIVNYRASNWFNSVEEVQRVTGMTAAYYNLIKDFVTVYPFINTDATRPSGSRAPININTAPREVLEAIFDPLGIKASDVVSLATDIINTRATTPFTCFYSSDTNVTSDFYDFVDTRSYLSTAERNKVLDNADASPLVPVPGFGGFNAVTTEFCYYTDAFKVESVGKIGDINLRVKNILKDDGNRLLSTYVGDTTLTGYWKESYE